MLVMEVWSPDGRHYLRYPNGFEFDIPPCDPIDAGDYIFMNGT